MIALRQLLARLRGSLQSPTGRRRAEADLREELEHHVAMHAEDNIRRGLSKDEAWRAARATAGGLTQAAESAREQQRLPFLETLGE